MSRRPYGAFVRAMASRHSSSRTYRNDHGVMENRGNEEAFRHGCCPLRWYCRRTATRKAVMFDSRVRTRNPPPGGPLSVDFDNQVVHADVPVNWTWIKSDEVIFGHAAFAGGRQFVTQVYRLDRRTGALETCDYAGDSEARARCSLQYVCRATSLTFDHAF